MTRTSIRVNSLLWIFIFILVSLLLKINSVAGNFMPSLFHVLLSFLFFYSIQFQGLQQHHQLLLKGNIEI